MNYNDYKKSHAVFIFLFFQGMGGVYGWVSWLGVGAGGWGQNVA